MITDGSHPSYFTPTRTELVQVTRLPNRLRKGPVARGEAERLAVALTAGFETLSRAEYYIRSGLSQSGVQVLADAIHEAAATATGSYSVPLDMGREEMENPRRPRLQP
jgi:hypothetical protein